LTDSLRTIGGAEGYAVRRRRLAAPQNGPKALGGQVTIAEAHMKNPEGATQRLRKKGADLERHHRILRPALVGQQRLGR